MSPTVLTDQMLKQVAKDMRGWLDQGIAVSIMSVSTFRPSDFHRNDLEQRISEPFGAAGVPLKYLLLEVTETVLMDGNDQKLADAIERLRQKGMLVALDDFGTGFASLTHLISFPVDIIKIDKSFVDRMLVDRSSRLIVESLIDLSRKLGMRIVAEGIESEAQAIRLRELGCIVRAGILFRAPGRCRPARPPCCATRRPEADSASER